MPDSLVESIREETKIEAPVSHTDVLAQKKSERGSVEESNLMTEIQSIRRTIRDETPELDLRIENGSYTVTNYFEDDLSPHTTVEDDGKPHRAKQKIKVSCAFMCIKSIPPVLTF